MIVILGNHFGLLAFRTFWKPIKTY